MSRLAGCRAASSNVVSKRCFSPDPDRPGSSSVYSMIRTTRPPSSRSAESGRRVELGQVRAVAQAADRSKHQVVLDPCQQVGLTLPHLLHQLVTQEITVPQ